MRMSTASTTTSRFAWALVALMAFGLFAASCARPACPGQITLDDQPATEVPG